MPIEMSKPQAVVLAEKVYVGGGGAECYEDCNQVFQYDPFQDEWSRLPSCPVVLFGMVQFVGSLITVGGGIPHGGGYTGNVYRFKEESNKWEEFLTPMPTARFCLSVTTTMQSAIVASGGATGFRDDDKAVPCATVEVYSSETSQWHTADPLPVLFWSMTSVTIADTWYLLGGNGTDGKYIATVLYASLTSLIQKATSPIHQSDSDLSVWETLPDIPMYLSAAASLSGNLLAVGGYSDENPASQAVQMFRQFMGWRDDKTSVSQAVHIFFPLTTSWVRVTTGDLPEPRSACTTVQLSSSRVIVVGGNDDQDKLTKTTFLGSITV